MYKIIDFISTKQFRNTFCFICFTVLMTITVASQNYFFQKIIENGRCTKEIIANKNITVIDTQKTERRKKEIAKSIEPILIQASDETMLSSLSAIKQAIERVRNDDISGKEKMEELNNLFDENLRHYILDYFLYTNNKDFNQLFNRAHDTLVDVLKGELTAKDVHNNEIAAKIKKNIPMYVPRVQVEPIITILNQVIISNFVVDETATNIIKKNAQDAVAPYEVIIKKGQTIVSPGDGITSLTREALRSAGYNVLEINILGILGIFVLITSFSYIFLQYEKKFEADYYNKESLLLLSVFTLIMALMAAVLPIGFSPYILPIPAYTMLLSIFTTPRNAYFASSMLLAILSIGMHYSVEFVASFLLINTIILILISKLKYSKRSDLIIMSLKITLAGIFIVGGIYFLEKYMMDISNMTILTDLIWLTLNCFGISGIILLGVLPIIENVFCVLTPYGLSELADYNQPLLKLLMDKASGTYSHSLVVSQLCEGAAEAIGANSVLARVGAMYHDIGKIQRPMFFVENQSFYGIDNPHKTCTPTFSKMLITAHPKDGLELAKKNRLPNVIYNFILQHHGTSLVSYFYNQAIKEEGEENVNKEQFRYPGPKPNSRETGILMLADAVESAVRAAKEPSNEEIDEIIQKIIKARLSDGQLDETPLTLKDIKTVAETFAKTLKGMYHERIKYPEDLLQSLNKNNTAPINSIDKDLEAKIQELENKRNEN